MVFQRIVGLAIFWTVIGHWTVGKTGCPFNQLSKQKYFRRYDCARAIMTVFIYMVFTGRIVKFSLSVRMFSITKMYWYFPQEVNHVLIL